MAVSCCPRLAKPLSRPNALDDGASRRRWDGQGDRLQATVGAGAGGVEVVEVQALLTQGVEIRREVAPVAIAAHVFGAETFDGHQHDVGFAQRARVGDGTADIQWVLADEACIGLAEFVAQLLGHDLGWQALVEL